MAITIPDPTLVRPTTKPVERIPAAAKTAVVNPCPVRVAVTGTQPTTGNPLVEPTVTRAGYLGMNIRSNTSGAGPNQEAYAVVRGVILEGYAGMTAGSEIFIDGTARPDPESTFSGLTHTAPVPADVAAPTAAEIRAQRPIGVAINPTKWYVFP